MIASVRGTVVIRRSESVVVECAGSATAWRCRRTLFSRCLRSGTRRSCTTHLIMRDDGMHLFGFAAEDERDLFLMLLGVQGVGPRSRSRCSRCTTASC